MPPYAFRQCTLTLLDKLFDLRQVFVSPLLDQWLQSELALSDYEQKTLQELPTLLNLNVPNWNEQELAQHFS